MAHDRTLPAKIAGRGLSAYQRMLIATFILFFSQPLQAQTTFPAADGIPLATDGLGRIGQTEGLAFRIETTNDSISIPGLTDWDDLRSYGGSFAVSWNRWSFGYARSGLTDRAAEAEKAKRIDESYLMITREVFRHDTRNVSLGVSAGAGALSLGDFAERAVQSRYHYMIGNLRPIPTVYDEAPASTQATAHVFFRLSTLTPILPVGFSGSLEASHAGFLRAGFFASAMPVTGFTNIGLWTGLRGSANQETGGAVFAKTVASENGWCAGVSVKIGGLSTGISYDISTGRPDAYYAFEFRYRDKDRERANRGRSPFTGEADVSLMPLNASYRLRVLALDRPLRLSPVTGFDCGTLSSMPNVAETELYRFVQYYAGIDAAWRFLGRLDLYAMAAGGVRAEQHRTRFETASQILGERTSPVGIAEGGLRAFMPAGAQRGKWGIGIGFGATLSNAYRQGPARYAQIRLIGAIQ
jgi:hypothetical protein